MKTESAAFVECIKRCNSAYQDLEGAKSDCNALIDAELDLLSKECNRTISNQERAQVKKFSKAVSAGNVDSVKVEAQALAQIVADFIHEPIRSVTPGERMIKPSQENLFVSLEASEISDD